MPKTPAVKAYLRRIMGAIHHIIQARDPLCGLCSQGNGHLTAVLSDALWKRAERLTKVRRQEQLQMQAYVGLERGHMEFLLRALDGETDGVEPPRLPPLSCAVDTRIEHRAHKFLRRLDLPIEPRERRSSTVGLPIYGVIGKIEEEYQAEGGSGQSTVFMGRQGLGLDGP